MAFLEQGEGYILDQEDKEVSSFVLKSIYS
jgi:hypothetical protein